LDPPDLPPDANEGEVFPFEYSPLTVGRPSFLLTPIDFSDPFPFQSFSRANTLLLHNHSPGPELPPHFVFFSDLSFGNLVPAPPVPPFAPPWDCPYSCQPLFHDFFFCSVFSWESPLPHLTIGRPSPLSCSPLPQVIRCLFFKRKHCVRLLTLIPGTYFPPPPPDV